METITSYYLLGLSFLAMRLNISSHDMGTIPFIFLLILCWHRSRPSNRTFPRLSDRTQTGNSDIHPMRCSESRFQLTRKQVADRHTCDLRLYFNESVLKIASLVDEELIVRPKRIVEGEITVLLRLIYIEQAGHVTNHFNAELAV
jgi:hypothetical protein